MGSSSRDYTYIDDIIAGVRAAIDFQAAPYQIVNLGNNRMVSLCEMVHMLEQLLGVRARLEHLPAQPGDVPRTCADITRAAQLLGYAPKTAFDRGLTLFLEWLRASDSYESQPP